MLNSLIKNSSFPTQKIKTHTGSSINLKLTFATILLFVMNIHNQVIFNESSCLFACEVLYWSKNVNAWRYSSYISLINHREIYGRPKNYLDLSSGTIYQGEKMTWMILAFGYFDIQFISRGHGIIDFLFLDNWRAFIGENEKWTALIFLLFREWSSNIVSRAFPPERGW